MCPERTHLPSPRTISNTLNADVNVPSNANTHMVAQFGQFLDHDFALTPEFHLGTIQILHKKIGWVGRFDLSKYGSLIILILEPAK